MDKKLVGGNEHSLFNAIKHQPQTNDCSMREAISCHLCFFGVVIVVNMAALQQKRVGT